MSKKAEVKEERAHALLSASGAKRWINCNGSARLEEQFEEVTSEYAEEGTLAHELAELKVRKYFLETGMAKRTYTAKVNKFKKNELWKDEMEGYTDEYFEYIQSIALSYPKEQSPYIIIESQLDFSKYVPESFGTADCVMLTGNKMYVIDLKYGKGLPVYAEGNPQLQMYALGAYLSYSLLYDIQEIQMAIVQPRLDNISEATILVKDLIAWAETVVKPNAERAFKGEGGFNAGDHCIFCRAKAQCRVRAERNLSVEEFKKDPILLSNEEIGEILKRTPDLAKWATDVKSYALKAALKGEVIPGWKAVEGKKTRAFTDTTAALNKLIDEKITEKAMLYEQSPLALTNVEKLVGKKVFSEVLAEFITISTGAPTLVKEEDSRETVTNVINAIDEFSVFDETNGI